MVRSVGSYTCQIFWKGDPSIENFIIRFKGEDDMKKWANQIHKQRQQYRESRAIRNSDGSRAGGTSVTEFTYLQNQPALENPYAQQAEDEEDEDLDTLVASGAPSWAGSNYPSTSDFSQSRNGSSSSLRSRSTTAESSSTASTQGPVMSSRAGPPRSAPGQFQQAQQPLTLRTQQLQQQAQSPGANGQDSYFSPTGDSPLSSARTSSSSSMYPFPRQPMPQNTYYEEGHAHTRYTAPAIGRREPSGPSNGYAPPRQGGMPRPSYPAGSGMHSAQQIPQPRNRSASSPDIHNGRQGRPPAALRPGGEQPPVPEVPVPYQQNPHMIPRSQSNSPNLMNGGVPPPITMNQSPQLQRERSYQQRAMQDPSPTSGYPYEGRADSRAMQHPGSRSMTPVPGRGTGTFSPAPPSTAASLPASSTMATLPDLAPPTQLKVKVHCPSASQTLTLVVPLNISYQSLKDRIDAKLQRSTNLALGDRGPKESQVKLKFLDEEDYVSIQSDEDVQTAFETWREQRGGEVGLGGMMGEIELFCQR
jgi:cell division control protein 24